MTTRRFHPTYPKGPAMVSGEIQLESPGEIGEEIPAGGFRRVLMPTIGAVMVLMFGMSLYMAISSHQAFSPQRLMMPMMFLMMGGAVFGAHAGSGSKTVPQIDAERKRYLRYLTGVRQRVAASAAQQLTFWGYHGPAPLDLAAHVGFGKQWSRRPAAAGGVSGEGGTFGGRDMRADLFMCARVGVGPAPAEDRLLKPSSTSSDLVGPDAAPQPYLEPVQHMALMKFLRVHAVIPNCPKLTSFAAHPTVAIGGDPDRAADLLRAIICQLALFHGPDVLQLRVRVPTTEADHTDWEWVKWLPHLHHDTTLGLCGPLRLIYPADEGEDYLRDLTARGPHQPNVYASTGPYIVIIDLDPASARATRRPDLWVPPISRVPMCGLTTSSTSAHPVSWLRGPALRQPGGGGRHWGPPISSVPMTRAPSLGALPDGH